LIFCRAAQHGLYEGGRALPQLNSVGAQHAAPAEAPPIIHQGGRPFHTSELNAHLLRAQPERLFSPRLLSHASASASIPDTNMRKYLVRLLILPLLVASASFACAAQNESKESVLVLVHANLIDGVSPEVLTDATIVVRGGRIESVGKNAAAPPAGAQVVDVKGRWLIPGFVDAHAHMNDLPAARRALQFGTTTARLLGVDHFADVGMRELHNNCWTDIPAVLAAGYQISPKMGTEFPFLLDFPNLYRLVSGVHGTDDVRAVVRAMASRHVDLIKFIATERAGTPDTDPRKRTFTDEEMSAIVDEARKAGLNVAAHAHGDEGARGAVLAGVHSIEHGTFLSDDTLALMKARGVYLVPTISAWDELEDNPILHQRSRAMQPRARDTAGRAWKMGVKVVAGTDSSYEATGLGLRMPDEIAELVRSGMPPMDAIKAGTSLSAECLGIEKRTGTIKPGMTADFIAVDGNPIANIVALQELVLIVHDGKVIVNRLSP
jgi:imidazolonepropionase-like amidohydrolase